MDIRFQERIPTLERLGRRFGEPSLAGLQQHIHNKRTTLHYTISEDRSGTREAIVSTILSRLGSRCEKGIAGLEQESHRSSGSERESGGAKDESRDADYSNADLSRRSALEMAKEHDLNLGYNRQSHDLDSPATFHARKLPETAGIVKNKARKFLPEIQVNYDDDKETAKRKKNTAAARKSRQRKMTITEAMEWEIQRLRGPSIEWEVIPMMRSRDFGFSGEWLLGFTSWQSAAEPPDADSSPEPRLSWMNRLPGVSMKPGLRKVQTPCGRSTRT